MREGKLSWQAILFKWWLHDFQRPICGLHGYAYLSQLEQSMNKFNTAIKLPCVSSSRDNKIWLHSAHSSFSLLSEQRVGGVTASGRERIGTKQEVHHQTMSYNTRSSPHGHIYQGRHMGRKLDQDTHDSDTLVWRFCEAEFEKFARNQYQLVFLADFLVVRGHVW